MPYYYIFIITLCVLKDNVVNGHSLKKGTADISSQNMKNSDETYQNVTFLDNFYNTDLAGYPRDKLDRTKRSVRRMLYPTLMIDPIEEERSRKASLKLVDKTIGDIYGSKQDGYNQCDSEISRHHLTRVVDKNGEWRVVIEQKSIYTAAETETCLNPGSKCRSNLINLPGIETTCLQKYTYMSVLVATLDNSGMETIQVSLPTACVCHFEANKSNDT